MTFNQYRTQVEVIQKGLALFGQMANRRNDLAACDDANLKRAFDAITPFRWQLSSDPAVRRFS